MAAITDDNSEESEDGNTLNRLLWGAGQLLAMGLVARFYRSYKRSHTPTPSREAAPTLQKLIDSINYKWYAWRQLVYAPTEIDEYARSATSMVLARQIQNLFDELHQQLLNLDPGEIAAVIPDVDQLRRFWARCSEDPETAATAHRNLPEHEDRWNRVEDELLELFDG